MSTSVGVVAWINWATPLACLIVPEGWNSIIASIMSAEISWLINVSSWAVNNSSVPFTEDSGFASSGIGLLLAEVSHVLVAIGIILMSTSVWLIAERNWWCVKFEAHSWNIWTVELSALHVGWAD